MIKVFAYPLDPVQQAEVKQLLSDYFARLVDDQLDRIWNERGLNQADLNQALHTHRRTPYQQ